MEIRWRQLSQLPVARHQRSGGRCNHSLAATTSLCCCNGPSKEPTWPNPPNDEGERAPFSTGWRRAPSRQPVALVISFWQSGRLVDCGCGSGHQRQAIGQRSDQAADWAGSEQASKLRRIERAALLFEVRISLPGLDLRAGAISRFEQRGRFT